VTVVRVSVVQEHVGDGVVTCVGCESQGPVPLAPQLFGETILDMV
jgi:hypothetical protein